MKNVLIGATGSVAALKLPFLVESLKDNDDSDEKINVSIFHSYQVTLTLSLTHQMLKSYQDFKIRLPKFYWNLRFI